MIAKYKGRYFCIDQDVDPVELWRYDAIEDFKKCTDDDLIYYSKFVDLSEIDEIFDVGFSVRWNGKWCGANPSPNQQTVSLLVGWSEGSFAKEHGFYEVEHDRGMVVAWGSEIPIDDCEEFRMTIEQEYPIEEERDEILSKEKWLDMYKKTEDELSPPY